MSDQGSAGAEGAQQQQPQQPSGAAKAMENFFKAPAAIGDFFSNTAKNTKESIHGLRQKIEYAAKQHSLAEDFKHDEAVALDIATLRHIKEQFRRLNKATDSILQHQKDFAADEFKYGNRMLKLSAVMDTPKHQDLFQTFAEFQLELSKHRNEYLNTVAKDLQTPVKSFVHTNIKQAQQKKEEINVASMVREELTKNYQKKQETESRKDQEKRDEAGVRLAEQKMNDCNMRYELLANEMAMLVLSLGLRKQHELPEQLLATMNAQEALLESSLKSLQEAKQKMAGLIKDIQDGNTGGTIAPSELKVKFKSGASAGPQLQFQRDGQREVRPETLEPQVVKLPKKKDRLVSTNSSSPTTPPDSLSPSASSTSISTAAATTYEFSMDALPALPPKPKKNPPAEAPVEAPAEQPRTDADQIVEVDLS